MVQQSRRRRARAAGVLLGVLLVVAVIVVRESAPAGPGGGAQAATTTADVESPLGPRTEPIFVALNADRADAGLAPLTLDVDLASTAATDACAIARGDVPLGGDEHLTTTAGAHGENTGLMIDDDVMSGAQRMHEWWATTHQHRTIRMDPTAGRYGVGACAAADRTYYVERFAR
jgi:uncharacterized protein YkwD